ncbi:hypothetical protein BEWA_021870 [Theileria equi strain WA]|uniref:Uncharacterized protein n=1 Tax=Theileria equi strain WA TaxID=1537102 RepID=L0AWR1_THEEQ|nr:hypothetical protein BEWA_021870 [Theileria equi strain WA]AFZ79339.1 hypothetical protein BEWA_021870 [Theileria equi strain WA]|eukprot:XP_004829005.1 hypothetical protein BEWA_021870 [Theileria equi strain WA]
MKLNISSDDINLLVYRYLIENGYCHTAFSFNKEASIANNPYYVNHADKIPPNALVSFMQKAMIYIYLEYHTDDITGEQIVCDEPFSFFRKHNCFRKIGQAHGLPLAHTTNVSRERTVAENASGSPEADNYGDKSTYDASSKGISGDNVSNEERENQAMDTSDAAKPAEFTREEALEDAKSNATQFNHPIFVGPPQRRLADKWQLFGYFKLLEYSAPNLAAVASFNPVIPGYILKSVENGPPSLYKFIPNNKTSICEMVVPTAKLKSNETEMGIGTCVQWRPDGRLICTGHSNGYINLWTIDGVITHSKSIFDSAITAVGFSGGKLFWQNDELPNTFSVAFGSAHGDVRIYTVDSDTFVLVDQYNHPNCVTEIEWKNDSILASVSTGGTLIVFDTKTKTNLTLPISIVNNAPFMSWDVFGKYLAIVDDTSVLKVYKSQGDGIQGEISHLRGHTAHIIDASWYRNFIEKTACRICTIGMDKQLIIWDVATESSIMSLTLDQMPTTVSINPTDAFLAIGSYGNSVKVYTLPNLTLACSFYDQTVVTNVSWSPDLQHVMYNVYNLQRSIIIPVNTLTPYQSD